MLYVRWIFLRWWLEPPASLGGWGLLVRGGRFWNPLTFGWGLLGKAGAFGEVVWARAFRNQRKYQLHSIWHCARSSRAVFPLTARRLYKQKRIFVLRFVNG